MPHDPTFADLGLAPALAAAAIANGNEEALMEQIESASEARANWSMAKYQK